MEVTFERGRELLAAVQFIHSFLPIIAATYYLIASLLKSLCSKTQKTATQDTKGLRLTLGCVMLLVLATYVGDSAVLISTLFSKTAPSPPQDSIVFALASSLLWFSTILAYIDAKSPPGYPLYGHWLIYSVTEVVLLSLSLQLNLPRTTLSIVTLVFQAIRLLILFLLPCVVFGSRLFTSKNVGSDEESAPLLRDSANGTQEGVNTENIYGSCNSQDNAQSTNDSQASKKSADSGLDEEDEDELKAKELSLWSFIANLRALAPFFWPSRQPKLQLLYVGVGICLVFERIMNIILPLQIGLIANILSRNDGVFPWKEIAFFIGLRLLDSSGGIQAIMKFMWVPLEDYSYKNLSTTAYNQIMSLSSDFHDSKNCGALWQAVIRGQNVKDMVNNLCFHIGPMVIDLALAVSVLYYLFDAYMALDIAAISVLFLWSSSKILTKQADKRREYIVNRSKEFTQMCETTSNWHTVSYFNHVSYEKSRYAARVADHLSSRRKFKIWAHLENTVQSLLLLLGLMVACFMAAYQVVKGNKPIGSFIMLLSYWAQLSSPLQLIANGFGGLAMDMVDMEEFLQLLNQKPTVTNRPNAKPMRLDHGDIEFVDVKFSYDGKREVLKNVNFKAKSGQTTALVGQTGGGKTTILKMLGRFYDPTSGSVRISGQDISQVTLESLRANIGLVPQAPALFYDTILNNIRYARLDATDEEIIEACKAVALHDRILKFTDGYKTMVGERGLKLSGGELQRVAIARVIIQNPKIVLLDEATSSVDSETEAHVQESLHRLSEGRTTFIIAHRLSTVIHADKILVVDDGKIVEEGSHAELLGIKGHYHRLWTFQGAFGVVKPKYGLRDTLIEGLEDEEPLVRKDSQTTVSLQRTGSSDDSEDISSSSGGSIVDGAMNRDYKQGIEPLSQIDTNCERDIYANNACSKKVWKPDAPEFVPRSHQGPPPTVLPLISTPQADTNGQHSNGNHLNGTAGRYAAKTAKSNGAAGLPNTSKENALPQASENVCLNGHSTRNGDHKAKPLSSRNGTVLGQHNTADECVLSSASELEHGAVAQKATEATPAYYAAPQKNSQRRREMTKSEPVGIGQTTTQDGHEDPPVVDSETALLTRRKKGQSTANQRRRRRNRNWNNNDNPRQRNKSSTDGTGSSS
ncbi:hypothetical protein AJ79_00958 [Helicocarpus griseus UAMH5409]|uniref:ABC transporter n=1 Tax=Helicocarpus griseus UAMH5409 TaxID=1447875 RepID=A0A2B7YB38_9EURO|nr:hypothetical protein AJ79_00958 [Helicocarpus griseus UAMH5409]